MWGKRTRTLHTHTNEKTRLSPGMVVLLRHRTLKRAADERRRRGSSYNNIHPSLRHVPPSSAVLVDETARDERKTNVTACVRARAVSRRSMDRSNPGSKQIRCRLQAPLPIALGICEEEKPLGEKGCTARVWDGRGKERERWRPRGKGKRGKRAESSCVRGKHGFDRNLSSAGEAGENKEKKDEKGAEADAARKDQSQCVRAISGCPPLARVLSKAYTGGMHTLCVCSTGIPARKLNLHVHADPPFEPRRMQPPSSSLEHLSPTTLFSPSPTSLSLWTGASLPSSPISDRPEHGNSINKRGGANEAVVPKEPLPR